MSDTPTSFPWKRNLIVLWFAQVATTVGFSFTFPFYPIFFGELGVEDAGRAAQLAGISGWLLGIGMGLMAPVWGVLGDRYGRKLNIIRALVLGGALLALSGYSQNPTQLMVSRFFIGATSGVVPTIMALVAAHTPRASMSFATGATMSALLLGTAIGPLVGGVIFDRYGMEAAFWATGAGLFSAAAMVIIFVREDFVPPEAYSNPLQPFKALWLLVRTSTFVPILLMVMMVHAGVLMATPAIAGLVANAEGGSESATLTGIVFGAIGVAGAISAVALGWAAGRYGLRRVFLIAAIGASLLSFGPFFANHIVVLTFAIAAASLCIGGLAGLLQGIIAMRTPPGQHGATFGAAQVSHALGVAFGPLIGGTAAAMWGFSSPFLVNAALFAIVFGLAVLTIGRGAAHEGQAQRTTAS